MIVAILHFPKGQVQLNDKGGWESEDQKLVDFFEYMFGKDRIEPTVSAGYSPYLNQVREAVSVLGGRIEWIMPVSEPIQGVH